MTAHSVWIGGRWQLSDSCGEFAARDPSRDVELPDRYPISGWADVERMLDAAVAAAAELREADPQAIAQFLERYAAGIEADADRLAEIAAMETGLPRAPRLREVELNRTTHQLRQAAAAARDFSWSLPVIDRAAGLRSYLAPLGPIALFGPNNFPLAYNAVSGGDFAAALAAGNPVIAKGHPLHPSTTRRLAEIAAAALSDCALPAATVQLVYQIPTELGLRLVADHRLGGAAFTGSRAAGLALKQAADAAGKPIYLEMSSVNPVVLLPAAVAERGDSIAEQFIASCTLGCGQFCTRPGLLLLIDDASGSRWIESAAARMAAATTGSLLDRSLAERLEAGIRQLVAGGARILAGGRRGAAPGSFTATLLAVDVDRFCRDPGVFQLDLFGPVSLIVVARDEPSLLAALERLEGQLTGTIYTSDKGGDERMYGEVARRLRPRVGRLINNRMPTGVAVSPAMNHGGPYPASGHPGFTAVGIPSALRRFAMLQCFDQVPDHRLPLPLRDRNPTGSLWRQIDGCWTQGDVS